MTIVFGVGAGAVVLGDDQATLQARHYSVRLEQWGAKCKVQDDDTAPAQGSASVQTGPYLAPLGNVRGPFSFVSTCSGPDYASLDQAVADFMAKKALVSSQDQLQVTAVLPGGASTTETYQGAVLEDVQRVAGESSGVRMAVRYTFRTSGLPTIS